MVTRITVEATGSSKAAVHRELREAASELMNDGWGVIGAELDWETNNEDRRHAHAGKVVIHVAAA